MAETEEDPSAEASAALLYETALLQSGFSLDDVKVRAGDPAAGGHPGWLCCAASGMSQPRRWEPGWLGPGTGAVWEWDMGPEL